MFKSKFNDNKLAGNGGKFINDATVLSSVGNTGRLSGNSLTFLGG